MAGNTFGKLFKITTFGESHGIALGAIIDGCPAGIALSEEIIQKELDRRRPGNHNAVKNSAVTNRKEPDTVIIQSGIFEGKTTGTPISLCIMNTSQISKDYSNIANSFRPGHADYTFTQKYGFRDFRGGGRSSGRETAARVAAGAVAKAVLQQILPHISVTAFTVEAAGIKAQTKDFSVIEKNPLRAADLLAAEKMNEKIEALRLQGDSAGGIIQCEINGIPAGIGEPVFEKLDAELAKAMLSIGAIKGIEFGAGFDSAHMTGSEWNDSMRENPENKAEPYFMTNNAGGILGGISNGNTIVFKVAVKPVPSIYKTQQTINKNFENCDLTIEGRHDICLCPRIIPVIEAMAYLVLVDLVMQNKNSKL